MKHLPLQGRTLALLAVLVPLVALFIYVGLNSGPLAPVDVTVVAVESRGITPALFGIGTVEARFTYRIGPTYPGRVRRLDVHVGDLVAAGQDLGEMDPVDLDDRVRSQRAALRSAEAALREVQARQSQAGIQLRRYEQMFARQLTSEESVTTRRQELQVADASVAAARADAARSLSDQAGLEALRSNLRLIAPVQGVVVARNADPGTTLVAGQAVVEIIDTGSLWINVRLDQISSAGLVAGLPARIALRSRQGQILKGRVLRVEPKADVVTEEMLAKVVFDAIPQPLPPVGELAEVTIELPALPARPTIANAAIRRQASTSGVWRIVDGKPAFTPVVLGAADLEGQVQVLEGLSKGDRIIVYSAAELGSRRRIRIVEHIAGTGS